MAKQQRRGTAAIEVTHGQPYGGGYIDADLRKSARTEGEVSLYDPDVWGTNRQPYLMDEVIKASEVGRALQGHELDRQRIDIEQVLDRLRPAVDRLKAAAVRAIDLLEHSIGHLDSVRDAIYEQGLPLPAAHRVRRVFLIIAMALVGFGEVFLLSPAFQVFGLRDAPLLWFLPFNEQHLAAISSLIALLALAHALGEDLKPPTPNGQTPSAASGSWFGRLAAASAGHRLTILGVFALLLGLAAVRELYLAARGEGSGWGAAGFMLLNLGMVLGVRTLARPDGRPYAAVWQSALRESDIAEQQVQTAGAAYEEQVAEYNAAIDEREALLSQYGHALAATAHDAERQIAMVAYETRLAQPEPVTEPMFDNPLPVTRAVQLQTDIRQYLTNAVSSPAGSVVGFSATLPPFHRYERLNTDDVRRRYEEMQTRLTAHPNQPTDPAGTPSSPTDGKDVTVSTVDPTKRPSEQPPASATHPNGASASSS